MDTIYPPQDLVVSVRMLVAPGQNFAKTLHNKKSYRGDSAFVLRFFSGKINSFFPESKGQWRVNLHWPFFWPKGVLKMSYDSNALLRIGQVIGDKKKKEPGIFPVSRSTWWAGVRSGKYPQPVKMGAMTFWRYVDVQDLIDSISKRMGS